MENTQILEGNKLIAEFIGVKPKENNWFDGYELHKAGLPFAYGAMGNGTNELKFHNSWDWLMLIVEKIENINDEQNIYESDFSFQFTNRITEYSCCIFMMHANTELFTIDAPTRITACYLSVIEFIKWYSLNK